MKIVIPTPPSANNLFATGRARRRFKTLAYQNWLREAGWNVLMQRPKPIRGRYTVAIILPNIPKNSDPDNRVKPILDLLVAHRLIDSDTCKHNAGFTVSVDRQCKGSTIVLVRPCPASPA